MRKFVIGVDGGNSKTDYFLFDIDGNFVDHINAGTCSHEALPDKYEGSYRVMKEHLDHLVTRNDLTYDQIAGAAFGLAGVDVPKQRAALEAVIEKIGFKNYVVDNDSFLGIKAALPNGYGVCSINGTGTVAGGIDAFSNRLQVGGIGDVSGDEAGGAFIARKVLRAVYDDLYRCSKPSQLTQPVLDLLKVEDKYYYIEAISELYSKRFNHTPYIQLAFECAQNGDEAAIEILDNTALQLAKSLCGCINNLKFETPVDIVLAGSVWVKPKTTILLDWFTEYVKTMITQSFNLIVLQVPPATGAVLWALEVAHGQPVDTDMREKVINKIETMFLTDEKVA